MDEALKVTAPQTTTSTGKFKGMCADYHTEGQKASHGVSGAVKTSADGALCITEASNDLEGAETRLREASLNILAVISDPSSRETVCRIIDEVGLKAISASTIHEAREILLHERIPLVICSARLRDGTYRELLSGTPKLFAWMVILCSGTCPSEARIDALELGILDYVSYPLPTEELLWVLRGAVLRSSKGKMEGVFRPGYDPRAIE